MKNRILVVDDHRDNADSLVRLLNILGYEAKPAYDGQRAIDIAAEFLPDMVFVDIGMPGFNGFDTVARIRRRHECAHAILVALTGYAQSEDRQRALQCGFDLHVPKPMDADTLTGLLELLKPDAKESTAACLRQAGRLPYRYGTLTLILSRREREAPSP
jgi:CheY-like chemotaxis protein